MEYHPKKVIKKQYRTTDQVLFLCQPKYLLQKMDLSTLLWIDESHPNYAFLSRTYPLQRAAQIDQAVKKIRERMISTIIISNKLSLEGINKLLYACPTIQCILIYCMNKKYAQQKMSKCPTIKGIAVDESQLKGLILKQQERKDKILPMSNMIKLNVEQLSWFNRKRISLYSIQGEKNMVNAFSDFCMLCQEANIQPMGYKNIEHDPESMLRYYTRESFLYKILNKTLKLAGSCLETAWIRYPYMQISRAIKARHRKEKTSMVTYRGAYFDKTELSNLRIGDVIESFGFLSTSLDEKCARIYIKNCFFRVQIEDPNLESEGYTCIKDISNFPQEEQVLINTKNLFEVKSILPKQKHIELTIKLLTKIPRDYQNAIQLYKQFMGDQGKALQEYDLDLALRFYQVKRQKAVIPNQYAQACYNIGHVYYKQEKYDNALDYYQKCLNQEISDKYLTIIYQIIGNVYFKQGNQDKALNYYLKSMNLGIQAFGEDNIQLAGSYNNIANIYTKQGNYHKSIDYFQKCLNLMVKAFGEDHIQLVSLYQSIGNNYFGQGNYDKSMDYYQKCLNIKIKAFGEDNIYLVSTYDGIGHIYDRQDNYDKALDYYQKCLNLTIKAFGDDNIRLTEIYLSIGLVHVKQNNYDKAQDYFHKCVNLKTNNIQLANTYNYIGKVYERQCNYKKALDYYEKCLKLRTKAFGHDNAQTKEVFESRQCMALKIQQH